MKTRQELDAEFERLCKHSDACLQNMGKLADESGRVAKVADNAEKILDDLDDQFEEATGLNKTDFAFLFFAVALQVLRQYLMTSFPERPDDQTSSKETPKPFGDEKSNRHHRLYNPSLEEICSNPVPFDANINANGNLAGGGSFGHRGTTLGHDGVIGIVVGTANIATSTLTNYKWESFHIQTNGRGRDFFSQRADTGLVFKHFFRNFYDKGSDGYLIVAASLIKEIIHLQSDINSKASLPIPGIMAFSPQMASNLAKIGLDMSNIANIGKQAAMACAINTLIAMLHGLTYLDKQGLDRKLGEVKTRKILMWSNIIASASNVVAALVTENPKILDVGGIIVTLARIYSDIDFIYKVKEEFIFGNFKNMIRGEELDLLPI
ncbi:hypothetical protein [Fibrobacter sp. UWH1]|uniref:hypothetical protein n=1 Tax=Fibrobacter sp. UWH1 TaxID=1964354 RepID=UPI000B661AE7|nr:hypothetical protein [Fibrobacter sp. UWH1]OWV15552.1 hypothetical protein B7992_03990 [Fibrobacter sp. UWH1]